MNPIRNIIVSLFCLVSILLFGTVSYHNIEHWSYIDALYMTVITLSTVGFREVHQLSEAGQIFTIIIIVFGTGVVAYAAGSVIQLIVQGQFRQILGRKKLLQKISNLENHYIICGYGRIGNFICHEFQAKPVPFVVVENNPELCEKLLEDGIFFIHGDATDDDTLIKAGITRANGLITAVTSDTANVYITLTARGLNPDLFILARSGEKSTEKKLIRAGASKVVSPYTIGANRMAQAILRPSVMDFIEIATAHQNLELQIEEICIHSSSNLVNQTLMSSDIRKELDIIIVAIKKLDTEKMLFNPSSQSLMEDGDTLITLGDPIAIKNLEKRARGVVK
ncbi:MAG: potassium transporter TrkA [Desulfuromonadales bacterium C00003068]|jgi:voltage-gated potassium channel|nr:MAG: potassium transporter TrkA [Desulfuromonadales bacterium C00003068]